MNVAQADINTFLAAAEDLQIKGLTQKETKNKELFDKDESDRGRRDISNKVLTEEGNFEIKSEPSLCQYNNEEAQNKQRELSVTTDHNIQNLEGYQSTGFNEEEYHDEHGNIHYTYIQVSSMNYEV